MGCLIKGEVNQGIMVHIAFISRYGATITFLLKYQLGIARKMDIRCLSYFSYDPLSTFLS